MVVRWGKGAECGLELLRCWGLESRLQADQKQAVQKAEASRPHGNSWKMHALWPASKRPLCRAEAECWKEMSSEHRCKVLISRT